jgi:hypothetical protein
VTSRRGKRVWGGILALVIVLLALAWIDGGREPLHEIAEPVAVPGAVQ